MKTSAHERYWLYRFIDAVETIERHGICRCDLDCLAPSEENRVRMLLGILQDFAHGYSEEGEQPRLSRALRVLMESEEEAPDEAIKADAATRTVANQVETTTRVEASSYSLVGGIAQPKEAAALSAQVLREVAERIRLRCSVLPRLLEPCLECRRDAEDVERIAAEMDAEVNR